VQLLNDKSNLETFHEPCSHRERRPGTPRFLPSRTVHIAYSVWPPAHGAWIEAQESTWGAYNSTLQQLVAHAWEVDISRVRLDSPREHDESMRYDFMIALPKTDSQSVIPELLRDAIQQQLEVDVTREDTDPPTIVIKPR